jgi:hypothetical protein
MQGTRTDLGEEAIGLSKLKTERAEAKKSEKQKCEEKGGFWDTQSMTCILLPKQETQKTEAKTPPVNPAKGTVETFSSSETGRASGVVTPDGRTFLGLSPDDVNTIAQGEAQRVARPINSAPVGTAQNEAQRQARLQQLMQLGEQGILTPQELQAIQESPIDWGQALTAGASNVPSLLTRAGAGAAAGFVATAPINAALAGTGIGAIPAGVIAGASALVGAISAIWSGTQSNIKSQQRGEIGASQDVLTQARTNMRSLAVVAAKDPSKAEEALQLYYQQLGQVQRAQRKIQMETRGNLNKFMEDGTDILSDFELFLQPGGYADIQLIRLQQAIQSGQPASDAEILQLYEELQNE